MTFLLSSKNVFDYLIEQGLCTLEEQYLSHVKSKSCKNFNLLVSLPKERYLLVKQECHDREGKTNGELFNEWIIHQCFQTFSQLSHICQVISEVIHFDSSHSIIVFKYLNDYCDLSDFYAKEDVFPTAIASEIGATLAEVHRTTIDCQEYKDFFSKNCQGISFDQAPNFLHGLERITPEDFGVISTDGLKFIELYQRCDGLGLAIAELNTAFESCCLAHNDLKFNNILLHIEWEQAFLKGAERSANSIVRLIDWEKWSWGDPACDLGTIIANYLKIWLSSLVISTDIDVQTALRLAATPLEAIQPSIAALIKAYFDNFPEIIHRRPDFWKRVVQFTGLALIEKIQVKIHYQKPFGNLGICMLQVAKTLLCQPEQSIGIIFGTTASELTCFGCQTA